MRFLEKDATLGEIFLFQPFSGLTLDEIATAVRRSCATGSLNSFTPSRTATGIPELISFAIIDVGRKLVLAITAIFLNSTPFLFLSFIESTTSRTSNSSLLRLISSTLPSLSLAETIFFSCL